MQKGQIGTLHCMQGLIAKLPKMLLSQQFVPESLVRELRLHTCTSSNLHICTFAVLQICIFVHLFVKDGNYCIHRRHHRQNLLKILCSQQFEPFALVRVWH